MKAESLLQGTRAVGAIVINTFREAVRNKIFGALLLFAVAIMLFSLVLGAMSLHNEVRVATDTTLFASTLFSMVLTVYVSINLIYTEIERRTIYTILSKPVRRWQFLVGKMLGILLLMAAIVTVLCLISGGLRVTQGGTFPLALVWSYVLIFFQLVIVAAISLLLATFSTPLLSGLLSAGVFLLGHLHGQFEQVREFFDSPVSHRLIDVLEVILPDLASMNLSAEIVRQMTVPASYLASAAWYTLSYTAVVLAGAILIFNRRDLI